MRTLIISSLFPPDVGTPAPYVKELATRLHEYVPTTLLVYGYLPEHIPGVDIIAIDKRITVWVRVIKFTLALWRLSQTHDTIIINNGPSTEFPALLVNYVLKRKIIILESDPRVTSRSHSRIYVWVHRSLQTRAAACITLPSEEAYRAAERLPFELYDEKKEQARLSWWQNHLQTLTSL